MGGRIIRQKKINQLALLSELMKSTSWKSLEKKIQDSEDSLTGFRTRNPGSLKNWFFLAKNQLPHTHNIDGHSASVNTISSSSVVMTKQSNQSKNQMNFEQFTI